MVAIQYIPPVAIEAHEQERARVRGKSFQPLHSLTEEEGKCNSSPLYGKGKPRTVHLPTTLLSTPFVKKHSR